MHNSSSHGHEHNVACEAVFQRRIACTAVRSQPVLPPPFFYGRIDEDWNYPPYPNLQKERKNGNFLGKRGLDPKHRNFKYFINSQFPGMRAEYYSIKFSCKVYRLKKNAVDTYYEEHLKASTCLPWLNWR